MRGYNTTIGDVIVIIETKILDKLSDSEKRKIEDDYQCFGWEIANAQKTDYKTVSESG